MYQCLGFVIMEDRNFNSGFFCSVLHLALSILCYYLHCVDILLINTWMDGLMDGWKSISKPQNSEQSQFAVVD